MPRCMHTESDFACSFASFRATARSFERVRSNPATLIRSADRVNTGQIRASTAAMTRMPIKIPIRRSRMGTRSRLVRTGKQDQVQGDANLDAEVGHPGAATPRSSRHKDNGTDHRQREAGIPCWA